MHEITDDAKRHAMQENAKRACCGRVPSSCSIGANIESQFAAVLADRCMRNADFGIAAGL
jgi:hypothetical protein